MAWSPEQDRALQAVANWLKDPSDQVFRLFGYAGTGKTTLAKHFAEGVSGEVLFGAFTGKAAHVLRQKGCKDATTIHSMIYHSSDKGRSRLLELEQELVNLRAELHHEFKCEAPQDEPPENIVAMVERQVGVLKLKKMILDERQDAAKPMFRLNRESAVADAKLVVIDECSMVDAQMGQDLLSFDTPILVLGDPAQLPPVAGDGYFTKDEDPDIMLQEIHRQAKDNPIIAMATQIRQEKTLDLGSYGDSRVVDGDLIKPEDALEADQILVGRNKTRTATNRRVRALLGHEENYPIPGDRVVCLRNHHELGLLNGAIWYVDDTGEVGPDRVMMTIVPDSGGEELTVNAHMHYFQGRGDQLSWWERKDADEFDYGYALTVHKAQGSQWNNVMLFDEAYCFRKDRWKWLYTGLTRAAEKVTLVRT